MRNRLALLAILVLALAAFSPGALAAGKGKIPSKTVAAPEEGIWQVKITPDPDAAAKGEKESEDQLLLRKGRFHSPGCDAFGFGPAPYRTAGGTWMSDTESKTDGRIHWHGEVSGDSISGEMVWTKTDGTVLKYGFTGSRASAQTSQTQSSGGKPRN
ncbi:MAG: hypothetical protein DMH00_06855 [Acidobacteria bacterium]|nr:MAG: hypothetical protein DMH00_06855 [Acidobacteriota bacterium]